MKETSKEHVYAVFSPAAEGDYNVSFPEFPGCVTFGRTFEEAQAMGRQELLGLWLEGLATHQYA
jgi:predicted RNase H-like HicB family nuclease